MIGHCWIELIQQDASTGADVVVETIRPWEDYGLYMVSYDAPPPKVRTYRANIEGRDGALDLTEWEGQNIVRYNDRTVTIAFRNMLGNSYGFISKLLGRRVNIHFDEDAEYYFVGRCDGITEEVRKHVGDMELTFTCHPFRRSIRTQTVTYEVAHGRQGTQHIIANHVHETLVCESPSVVPVISVTGVEDNLFHDNMVAIYTDGVFQSENRTVIEFHNNGVINSLGAKLTLGDNVVGMWNYNEENTMSVTLTWHPEVI